MVTRAGSPQPLIEAASARSCRQPPPTRQRSGHYHAATLWETPPNWQLPRQIAGSQGNAGRAGAEFSRAEPSLRSSAGWSLAGRRMRPPRRSETQPLSRRGRAAGRRGTEKCYEKPQKRPVG